MGILYNKKERIKGQTIEKIDEDILQNKYNGNKRNYLYHEDPGYHEFIGQQNLKRHNERLKTDPIYKRKWTESAKYHSISEKTYKKNIKKQTERRKENKEYYNFKLNLTRDPLYPRDTNNELKAKEITHMSDLGPELEIRELTDLGY